MNPSPVRPCIFVNRPNANALSRNIGLAFLTLRSIAPCRFNFVDWHLFLFCIFVVLVGWIVRLLGIFFVELIIIVFVIVVIIVSGRLVTVLTTSRCRRGGGGFGTEVAREGTFLNLIPIE